MTSSPSPSPTLKTANGGVVPLDSLPLWGDWDDLARVVSSLDILLEPLQGDAVQLNPDLLREDLEAYAREVLETRRVERMELATSGSVGEASFWVFRFQALLPAAQKGRGAGGPAAMYAMLIRDVPMAEFACCEAVVEISGEGRVPLTPEQAAVLEWLTQGEDEGPP